MGSRSPSVLVRPSSARPSRPRTPGPRQLVAFERSLATGPLERLERTALAWSDDRAAAAFDLDPGLCELGVLKTCHRLEVYAVVADPGAIERVERLLPGPRPGWRRWEGRAAVRHLFHVAGGLESLAVGEREVQAQVRRAGGRILTRLPNSGLRAIFDGAADAAAAVGRPDGTEVSVARLGASRLLEEVGPPFPRVVVAGSGVVGRQVVEALSPAARVTILYRRSPPTEEFLRATGARAAPLAELPGELALADGLVTALKSAGRLVGPAELVERDPNRPLVVIDLGLPRNVDPAVSAGRRVRRIDLAHLRPAATPSHAEASRRMLEEQAERALRTFGRTALEPLLAELWRQAERIRAEELGRAAPFLGGLTAQQRASVGKLTERVVRRILSIPTERLRELAVVEDDATVRELAMALFVAPTP